MTIRQSDDPIMRIVLRDAAGGLASPPPGMAKELKVATFLPPTHPIVALYEQLGKELAAETNGDLTLKVYPGGTLGAGPFQQYKRAVEGVTDIADICHPFHAKVFAKTMLIVLPGGRQRHRRHHAAVGRAGGADGERLQGGPERLHVLGAAGNHHLARQAGAHDGRPQGHEDHDAGRGVRADHRRLGRFPGAHGPQRDVQRAFDRRGRRGRAHADRAAAAVAAGGNLQIRHRRRVGPVQPVRRRS